MPVQMFVHVYTRTCRMPGNGERQRAHRMAFLNGSAIVQVALSPVSIPLSEHAVSAGATLANPFGFDPALEFRGR